MIDLTKYPASKLVEPLDRVLVDTVLDLVKDGPLGPSVKNPFISLGYLQNNMNLYRVHGREGSSKLSLYTDSKSEENPLKIVSALRGAFESAPNSQLRYHIELVNYQPVENHPAGRDMNARAFWLPSVVLVTTAPSPQYYETNNNDKWDAISYINSVGMNLIERGLKSGQKPFWITSNYPFMDMGDLANIRDQKHQRRVNPSDLKYLLERIEANAKVIL